MPAVRKHRIVEGIIGPVDYTAQTRYRGTPSLYQRLQPLGWWLTRHGLSPAYVVTLEVPGRRSSIIRRTTLVQVVLDGQRFLVSLAGESDWVRNVRAAGGHAVLGRRERRAVTLHEVAADQRPPVIQAYLGRAGRTGRSWGRAVEARHYFGVGVEARSDEIAEVADRYPVFRVEPGPVDAGTAGAREIAPDVFWLGLPGRTRTNVYFVRSGPAWVLVDAGWAKDGPRIENAARELFGAAGRPAAILLTHVHPDHAGSARYLARRWGCAVYVHPKELPIANADFESMVTFAGPLDRWVVLPLMRALGRRRRAAALARSSLGTLARPVEPGRGLPGLPDWECVPTPGHTPGHVAYFRPADRVLISGDAVVTLRIRTVRGLLTARPGLSGPPWYTTWNATATAASIGRLAALGPSVLAGGHGTPRTGPGTAAALSATARSSAPAMVADRPRRRPASSPGRSGPGG